MQSELFWIWIWLWIWPWIENLALNKQKVMKALELFCQLASGVDAKTDGNVFSSSGKKTLPRDQESLGPVPCLAVALQQLHLDF